MTVPVLDLHAEQQALFDAELLSGVLKTPRQRRLELRESFNKALEEMEVKRKSWVERLWKRCKGQSEASRKDRLCNERFR